VPSARSRKAATGEETSDVQGVRSIQRALDVLSLLSEERPLIAIRDIVAATGLAKTTVIRIVQTLEQSGLLWATGSGYMAGPGLWRWAHLAKRGWELPPETQRLMRELAAGERETVNVYVDDNNGGCSGGVNHDGPGGLAYPCKGSLYTMSL